MKNCINVLLLSVLLLSAFAYANSKPKNQKSKYSENYLPDNDVRYIEVKKIYDKLVFAIFDNREAPKFRILKMGKSDECHGKDSGFAAAWIGCPNSPIVFLEEDIYDIYSSFGENKEAALSFILGHELAHYYRNHFIKNKENQLTRKYGFSYSKKEGNGFEAKYIQDTLMPIEYEADKFAAAYSYLAGYDSRDVFQPFLNNIYNYLSVRGINDSNLINSGYLPKNARFQVADSVAIWLRDYIPTYDAANFLYITQNYTDAIKYFEQISKSFPTKDIFNNMGVCYAQCALLTASAELRKYCFPFSFEDTSQIERRITSKGLHEDSLWFARESFQNAIKQDPKYWTAHINLACILILQDSSNKAIDMLERLESQIKEPAILANAHIAFGIAYSRLNNNKIAEIFFTKAKNGNKDFALVNLSVINPKIKINENPKVAYKDIDFLNERICNTNLNDSATRISKRDTLKNGIRFYRNVDNCSAFSFRQFDSNNTNHTIIITDYFFISAEKNYKDENQFGIKINDNFSEVTQNTKYGHYKYITQSNSSNYFVYDNETQNDRYKYRRGIIFKVGKQSGKIESWTIFEKAITIR